MNQNQAMQVLRKWDKEGRFVFTKHELAKFFPEDNAKTFSEGLHRLVKTNVLQRACRGVYVNPQATCFDSDVIRYIAKALRLGEYNYISLESMLSEYGVISQIPIDRLTVMTTGREGVYKTCYGVIEMTHTKRSTTDILKSTYLIKNKPLRVATKEIALRDLKRVGRNLNLIQSEEINDD